MKYIVTYQSGTGNTALLAETIKIQLGEQDCCYYGEPSETAKEQAQDADLIFVGFWTNRGSCNEAVKQFLSGLKDKKIVLFGTAGFGGSKEYFEQILERVEQDIDSSNEIIETFMCQGKMPQSVKERYEKLLEKNPEDKNTKMLLANFEMASTHPDEKDIEVWKEKLKLEF